jgi:RimJ/RimL family protein N-acetyltransferase
MTGTWLHAPEGTAAAIAAAVAAAVPVIATPRLRLRAPVIGDYPAYRDVFVSDRARYIGGPFMEDEAFADFCQGIAGWMLRGAGMWTITRADDDAPLGWLYLWQEMGDPEPEIGWILTAAAEGQGFASEAALAVLPHAVALFGAGGFVSYIDADNAASVRLALRLGAVRDPAAEAQMAALGETGLHVYRHSGKGVPV